jgi:site-specific DNA recombinase
MKEAIIYCRVSSLRQVKEGNGLASQEQRCRSYAESKNYKVTGVFRDEGTSGAIFDRQGIVELTDYLKNHKGTVVIIDDISRLARDIQVHHTLRALLGSYGATLESPSMTFEDSPEGSFIENIHASLAQYHRQQNARQVKNRMKARLQQGIWVFNLPVGYKRIKHSGNQKQIIKDELVASIVKEGLEGFASGRFQQIIELQSFFESQKEFPKGKKNTVRHEQVADMLKTPLYAGFIHKPEWEVLMLRGQHPAIISPQTYQRIQNRLGKKTKVPTRVDLNLDFPLRGFITCFHCKNALTASWTKGRNKKYPYYHCANKNCVNFSKSIKRAEIEDGFQKLLTEMSSKPTIVEMTEKIVLDVWQRRLQSFNQTKQEGLKELEAIETKIKTLVDKIISVEDPSLSPIYEKRLGEMNQEKQQLEFRAVETMNVDTDFKTVLSKVLGFISKPDKIWREGNFQTKSMVLKLTFADRISYCKNVGFGTASTTFPYKVFQGFGDGDYALVDPSGIEPLTSRMPCERSTS